MNILHVTPFYHPEFQYGGPPRKIHQLNLGLLNLGVRTEVMTFHSEHAGGGTAWVEGISVQYLPWAGRGQRRLPRRLKALADAIARADVVHCYGLYNALCPPAAMLAMALRKPYVLEPLGMYGVRGRHGPAKRLYHLTTTSWMARRAAAVVATSRTEADDLRLLVPTSRLDIRANGVDVPSLPSPPDAERFRQKHGLEPRDTVALFIGRISPIKNLDGLVRAFAAVAQPHTRLLLAGPPEPDYSASLSALISFLRLDDQVRVLPPVYGSDRLATLAAADLFVLPSHFESFGNAAAEAAVAGLPVLLTSACGVAPVIDGRSGCAVGSGDAELAAGLQLMLARPEAFRPSAADLAALRSELSWQRPLDQTIALYERVAGSASA